MADTLENTTLNEDIVFPAADGSPADPVVDSPSAEDAPTASNGSQADHTAKGVLQPEDSEPDISQEEPDSGDELHEEPSQGEAPRPAVKKKRPAGKKPAKKKGGKKGKKKKNSRWKNSKVAKALRYAGSTTLANIKGALHRLGKSMRRSRRVFATVILLGILFVGIIAGLTAVYIIHKSDDLPMPMRYSNETMAYQTTTEAALETDKAFTFTICTGKDDIGNENINLKEGESGALFNLEGREILFSKNMYDKIYPASITKIMTAIVTLKYGDLDETVTINWRDLELEQGSQVVGLKIGDKVTVRELLCGVLVHSGNDCAMALARHIGGSTEKFVKMMNSELQEIGATGTHFVNPTGLHSEDHYTTVYDIYLMLNEAVSYSDFKSIMQIPVYNLNFTDKDGNEKNINFDATDQYLTGETKPPKNVVVLGGKTGTTNAAGHCLAIMSQNAFGQPYISIIVGAKTTEDLYTDMNQLLAEINE
jgi:D-alanyl-D-alanine carboxypeptidase